MKRGNKVFSLGGLHTEIHPEKPLVYNYRISEKNRQDMTVARAVQ